MFIVRYDDQTREEVSGSGGVARRVLVTRINTRGFAVP
jgi:hypothetical protein